MNTDEVRQIIDEANRKFGAALTRKDYAGVAAFYTEDAKVLPPDAPIVSGGSKAIEEFWRAGANALGITDATQKTIDLQVVGETAYEVGETDLKLSSGKQAKAKYLVVWTRGLDGQWRLHRDCWNNMPAS